MQRPRGYRLHPAQKGYVGDSGLRAQHRGRDAHRALYTIVDQGGIVVDVAVENSLYGELRGNLNLASRYGVDNFIQQAEKYAGKPAEPRPAVCCIHCTARMPTAHERIRQALDEKGILYRKE